MCNILWLLGITKIDSDSVLYIFLQKLHKIMIFSKFVEAIKICSNYILHKMSNIPDI